MHTFIVVAVGYLAVNLTLAVLFHVHGLRQAHLPLRFLDVLMHFVLFSALALPVLVVISTEAFLAKNESQTGPYGPLAQGR